MHGLFNFNISIGFADVEDGITIDLSAMNELTLKRSANIISVGPGARWQSVYDLLDQYNISVQGGRNGHVGVGGYLLGGMNVLCTSNILHATDQ
jgi:FAD/FMN-containing dehydrogenase